MPEADTTEGDDGMPPWGGSIDQERLGKALVEMGERILDDSKDGIGVTGADFTEEFRWNEFTGFAFTLRYSKPRSELVADPIRYKESGIEE